jgi:DNA-binding CsgD family transcriptional regulator
VRAFLGEDKLARTDAGDIGELSDREREVFELGRQGMSNEQIAERL